MEHSVEHGIEHSRKSISLLTMGTVLLLMMTLWRMLLLMMMLRLMTTWVGLFLQQRLKWCYPWWRE